MSASMRVLVVRDASASKRESNMCIDCVEYVVVEGPTGGLYKGGCPGGRTWLSMLDVSRSYRRGDCWLSPTAAAAVELSAIRAVAIAPYGCRGLVYPRCPLGVLRRSCRCLESGVK